MLDSRHPITETNDAIKEMKKPESGGALDALVPPSPRFEGQDAAGATKSPTRDCPQQDPPHILPSSAPIAAEIVTLGTSNNPSEMLSQVHMMTQLAHLQRQVAEGEAERGRQLQYIMEMHAWAAKTAVSMRQMQEQCDMVRHSLVQVQAQQEATACTVQQLETLAALNTGVPKRRGKRQRTERLTRASTIDSLNLALSSSAREFSEDNNNNGNKNNNDKNDNANNNAANKSPSP